MSPEEREKIYSNEYFDLIIEYNGDPYILEAFSGYLVNIINMFLAIAYKHN